MNNMNEMAYFVGFVLGLLIYSVLKTLLAARRFNKKERWVKSLSPDKKPEPFRGGMILYANGSRWYLETHVTWRLFWLPKSSGDDFGKTLDSAWSSLEFQATWLPKRKMYRMIRRIIFTHPNLEARGIWKIIKMFS